MDLLLSVPVASYFLAPSSAFSSFSTSLNLLFFYMTWSTLVLSQPPLAVHLVGVTALRLVFWLIPSLLGLLLDLAVPSLAQDLKHGGRSALPPADPRRLARLLALALANLALLTLVEGALSLAFAYTFRRPDFRTSTTLPLPWAVAKHVLALVAAREVLTYYVHRFALHSSSSRDHPLAAAARFLSRRHARFAHARPAAAPFSLLLYADHPLPLLLHRLLPLYLPAAALRPHMLTYLLFVALCTVEETTASSGYSVAPGIIMGGVARRGAVHYAGGGAANFGVWGLLDWAHGSGAGRDVLDDVRDEAEKHHLKERSMAKADEGAGLIQDGIDAVRENGSPRRSGRKRTARKE